LNTQENGHIRNYYIFGRPTTKKNHGQIIMHPPVIPGGKKRRMFIPSKQFNAYQDMALEQLALQHNGHVAIDFPVRVRALYYFKDGRQADLINLEQATADILQKAGVLHDDKYIVSWDGSRAFYKCVEHVARIEIYRILPQAIDDYLSLLAEAVALKTLSGN
jgi:Holliday junction resolvase RusA-like endonuclease